MAPRCTQGRPGAFVAPRLHGRAADALAAAGDEGRGKLRKARVRSTHPLTPGYPNGVTRMMRIMH